MFRIFNVKNEKLIEKRGFNLTTVIQIEDYEDGGYDYSIVGSAGAYKIRDNKVMGFDNFIVKKREKLAQSLRPKPCEVTTSIFESSKEINPQEIYIVTGKTFEIKDQLKSDGAKWNGSSKSWYFEKENPKYNIEIAYLITFDLFKDGAKND